MFRNSVLFRNRTVTVTLAVIVSVFFVVAVVEGASTISTNISTDGNLSVTGDSSLGDTVVDGVATTTGLVVNGGTRITGHYSSGLSNLDVPSLASSTCTTQVMTVTGAETGDTVYVAAPATINAGLVWSAYVVDDDEVAVSICNVGGSDPANPAAGIWRADVWKHSNSLPAAPIPVP